MTSSVTVSDDREPAPAREPERRRQGTGTGPGPPDGTRVVDRGDLEFDERIELFATEVVHGPLPRRP